ncbi:exosome complex component MTR3 [Hordeum vulgare]|nr:exosome complex component MTR3 [Hordeum vulgare]
MGLHEYATLQVKWSNNGVFLLPLCSLRNILRRRSVMQTGPTTVASGSAYADFGKTKVIVSVFGPRESKKAMLYSDTGRLNCSVSYITFATGIRGQIDSMHLHFRGWKTKSTLECFTKPWKAQ